MKANDFLVLIERDEDGVLVASVPGLRGCHTQAKTLPVLMKRIQEAIRACVKSSPHLPKPLKFVGIQEVRA